MVKKSGKQPPYHHGDLREALIQHSLTIIELEGIGGLTLRKAARHAGVSHAAPAHHFGDMAGLLAAIAEEGFLKMIQQMKEAIQHFPDKNPLDKLKSIGLAYIEFAIQHPSSFKVMYHSELSGKHLYPGLERQSKNTFELLKSIVLECQNKQLLMPGDIEKLSLFAWSTVHGFATLAVDHQLEGKGFGEDVMQYADNMTNIIYSGLCMQETQTDNVKTNYTG